MESVRIPSGAHTLCIQTAVVGPAFKLWQEDKEDTGGVRSRPRWWDQQAGGTGRVEDQESGHETDIMVSGLAASH